MARSLVIVESPAKARTINRYLGKDYIVESSVGHIRDSADGGKAGDPKARAKEAAKTRKLSPKQKAVQEASAPVAAGAAHGCRPGAKWEAEYEILPGKEKVVDELPSWPKNAETIYLATDLDREGEAIAWHLREAIGGDERYRRGGVQRDTAKRFRRRLKPHRLDHESGERAAGATVSRPGRRLRAVASAVGQGRPGPVGGRVQSVAVRLVVEREREIRAFVPEEYWEAFADLRAGRRREAVRFQVAKIGARTFRRTTAAEAAAGALARARVSRRKPRRPADSQPGRMPRSSPRRCSRPQHAPELQRAKRP